MSTFDEDAFLTAHGALVDEEYEDWSANPIGYEYVVHHAGPDDVYYARSWREAVGVAHQLNAGTVTYSHRTHHDGMVRSWATPYLRADAVAAGVIREDS